MRTELFSLSAITLLLGALAGGCEPASHPQGIDSQTNWLEACQIDAQCGSSSACVCGVCTNTCEEDAACSGLPGTVCVLANDTGAVAQCGGTPTTAAGLCLPRCESDTACAKEQMCVAGVCTPIPQATAHVGVDARYAHQTLTGFGASVAYSEDEITKHPQRAQLYSTLFSELGLDVLRFRNRYGHAGDDDLTTASTLLTAASASLGRTPTIFLTSWSPPPSLKANAAVECSGNPGTCTLTKKNGAFDYAGFGSFWRSSLDAYAAVGVIPDYIGLQNNPNWLPLVGFTGEACVFLPTEGTSNVSAGGTTVSVRYPGFAEATSATLDALKGLATIPKLLAPETSDFASVPDYVAALDPATLAAVAHHMYGTDPTNVDLTTLANVGALAADAEKPAFQTEMQADGLGTALLIHYTTTVENAAAYLQSNLTSSATGPTTNDEALVFVGTSTFNRLEPYYSVQHFARYTDPGWVRIDATSSASNLLASAWLSPDGSATTVVLINAGATALDTSLELTAGQHPSSSLVTRTVFSGVERGTPLGSLSRQGILRLPPRSVVTVAFSD